MRCAAVVFGIAVALLAGLGGPASGASAAKWTLTQLPPQPIGDAEPYQSALSGVACPSDSLCVAVGAFDTIASSRVPTAGAGSWDVVHPMYDEPKQSCLEEDQAPGFCDSPRGSMRAVSCAGEAFASRWGTKAPSSPRPTRSEARRTGR